MLKISLQYLRMIVFVAGVLFGVQVPGVVDQYGKALKAHEKESLLSVRAFQDDADRYFEGDLQKLMDYYASSSDAVVNEGGKSIASLVRRHTVLSEAVDAFYENSFSPYWQFGFNPLLDVRSQVLENYTYTVVLNLNAIIVGILLALLLTICLDTCCFATRRGCSACLRKFRAKQS